MKDWKVLLVICVLIFSTFVTNTSFLSKGYNSMDLSKKDFIHLPNISIEGYYWNVFSVEIRNYTFNETIYMRHIPIVEGCNLLTEPQLIEFRLNGPIYTNITNITPIVNFDYFVSYENGSLIYHFESNAIDLDGYIVNYSWDFGDGNVAYRKDVLHEFAEGGIYNVTLCVTDNDGLIGKISKEIAVIMGASIPNISFVKLNESLLVVSCDSGVYWDDILIKIYNATTFCTINLSGEVKAGDQINISSINLTGNITVSIIWKPTYTILATYDFIIAPYAKIFVNECKASKNKEIIIPIWIEGAWASAGYADIYVSYEPSIISIENVIIPSPWENGWWDDGGWKIIGNHTIEIWGWKNRPFFLNGKYLFANMIFKVKGEVSSSSVIDLQLIDYIGYPYPTLLDGLVKIFPTLKLIPENAFIPFGSNFSFDLVIDELRCGLAGYNISLRPSLRFFVWQNMSWLNITIPPLQIISIINVSFPEWAVLHKWGTVGWIFPSIWWLKALDLNDYVVENATNVTLATITVKPNSVGKGSLNILINRLDDDNGYPIDVTVENATITVFEALPSHNPPTDPDGDGLYEDINGNGLVDFDDVVEFFQHFEWIEANWPTNIVDFNGNELVDFDDVVELFKEV